VIGQFVKEQTAINQAVRTGGMSAAEADARYRGNFSSFAERHPGFIEDFRKASDALKGASEQGTVDTEIRLQREQRQKDIADAAKDGVVFVAGMSEETVSGALKNHKARVAARLQFQDVVAQNNEARTQANYNQAVGDRQIKEAASKLVTTIASGELQDFRRFASELGGMVRSGKITQPDAEVKLGERFTNIEIALQAAAKSNPELAAPYRSIFSTANTLGQKLIDKKTMAEDVKNELDVMVGRMQLMAAQSNPRILAAIATSRMLSGSVDAALAMSGEAVNAFNVMATTPLKSGEYVPQVIGNPGVEKEVLGYLKEGIKGLAKLKGTDKEKAELEASTSVNQVLAQVGNFLDRGATPDNLVGVAKFLASPQYAEMEAKGLVSPEARQTAGKTFEMVYKPAIEVDVRKKLNEYLYEKGRINLSSVNGKNPRQPAEPKVLNDYVDIKFSGTSISFVGKNMESLDPAQQTDAVAKMKNLNGVEAAVNQLIKIGAHMEGTTNYAKFWENNKHEWFPDRFKAPESEKPTAKTGSEEQIIKAALGDIANVKLSEQELAEIQAALKESLKRGDLKPEARKSIEKSLGRY
jgi:hypothetical protein